MEELAFGMTPKSSMLCGSFSQLCGWLMRFNGVANV